jgi:hypothetical protein
MSILGSPGSEDRKKFYAACGFALVAVVYLYFQFFRDSGTPAVAPPPVVVTAPVSSPTAGKPAGVSGGSGASAGTGAKVVGITSAALDPTLHIEAMLVTESMEYSGTGRNIFSAMSAPVVVAIPKPITSARPQPVVATGPPPPPPPPPTCPPQCPPIDLKFTGTLETPPGSGNRRAFVLHGEDVWVASAGDIVMRRYRIVSISAKSIEVEDMPNNNKQTLPLLPSQ